MREVLNLSLVVDDGHVVECARELQARLRPGQWLLLRQLAAELTAIGESAAAGERMVVCPASELGAALSALKLAGRE